MENIWEKAQKRIQALEAHLNGDLSPEKREEILHKRAGKIARPPKEENFDFMEVLEFSLETETYALETKFISQVCIKEITPFSFLPPFILGIIYVHGKIRSVLSLKNLFQIPSTKKSPSLSGPVVVVSWGKMEVGFLADSLGKIKQISRIQNQPLPSHFSHSTKYLQGILPDCVAWLDMEKLLQDRDLLVNEEV